MAGQLTDIQAEDENKTNSLIPRSKDTIAEKAKLVSFWFAIFLRNSCNRFHVWWAKHCLLLSQIGTRQSSKDGDTNSF